MDVLRGSILAWSFKKKREYVEKSWLWHLLETVLWFSSGGWGFQQVTPTMCVISDHTGPPSTPLVLWKRSRCKYHFQILIKYAFSYWSHSFCLHQVIAAGMGSPRSLWCSACFRGGITDLVRSLVVLHPWHLSWSSCLTLSVVFVSSELCLSHVASICQILNTLPQQECAFYSDRLYSREILWINSSWRISLEAKSWRLSSYDWQRDLGKRGNIWETRKCLDLSGRKGALCSRLGSILHHYL